MSFFFFFFPKLLPRFCIRNFFLLRFTHVSLPLAPVHNWRKSVPCSFSLTCKSSSLGGRRIIVEGKRWRKEGRKEGRKSSSVLPQSTEDVPSCFLLAGHVRLTAVSLLSDVQSDLLTVAITSVQVKINWITGWLPRTPRWAYQSRPVRYTDPLSPSSIFM